MLPAARRKVRKGPSSPWGPAHSRLLSIARVACLAGHSHWGLSFPLTSSGGIGLEARGPKGHSWVKATPQGSAGPRGGADACHAFAYRLTCLFPASPTGPWWRNPQGYLGWDQLGVLPGAGPRPGAAGPGLGLWTSASKPQPWAAKQVPVRDEACRCMSSNLGW